MGWIMRYVFPEQGAPPPVRKRRGGPEGLTLLETAFRD